MTYFEWPLRQWGYVLLALYVLVFVALFIRIVLDYSRRRQEFKGSWIHRIQWMIAWIVLGVLLANTLKIDWPDPHLSRGIGQNREMIAILAFVPIVLAAVQLGVGPAVLVGLASGWVSGAYGSARLLQIFEVGIFGLLVSLLLHQDYQGRLGEFLRQPLLVVPWAGATTWLLAYLSIYAYTGQNMSSLSAVSTSMQVAVSNLPVILIESLVAGGVLQIIYALWPRMRAVHGATRVPPYARSIRLRFLYFFVPGAAIVLVVVLSFVMAQALRIAIAQSIDQNAHVANNVSLELPFFRWTGQQLLNGLALDDDLQSTEYERREASLERGIKTLPFFNQIALVDNSDPERIPRNIVPPPQKHDRLTAEEHALLELTLRDGSPQVSSVHKDPSEVPIISFLVPVKSAFAPQEIDGALIGRVYISENYQLNSMISNLQPAGEGESDRGVGFLINQENQIVAHPEISEVLGRWAPNPDPSGVHETPNPLSTVYEDINEQDQTRQLVYTLRTEGSPWQIVIIRPYDNVLSQATEISSRLLILLILAGLVITVGVPVFMARLTEPLKTLSVAAGEIADNRMDVPVRVTGEDEVGQLGRSFEQMRQRLQERMAELSLLLEVSREVSTSIELEPSLMPIIEGATLLTGGVAGRIILINERGKPKTSITSGTAPMQAALARLDQAVDVVVKRNRELPIEDLTRGRRAPPVELLQAGIRAVVGLPLRLQDRVTGVFWVGYGQPRRFGQADLRFLYTLAGQAAVVAENAQLFEDVEEERARLSAILSGTNDVVIVVDGHGYVLLTNPAAMQTYGIIPHEVVGLPLEEAIADPSLRDLLTRTMTVGSALTDEIQAPDRRTFSASVSLLAGGGRVVTLRDITYLKELDQMKSDFVNTVSHDLRSPLTYVRGYTTMISTAGDLDEKQAGFVGKILNGIEQMTELIDDLLDIGKIEAGVGVEIERCLMPTIVQAVVDDLGMRAAAQDVQLVTLLPPDIPPTLAYKTLVRQAIHNLVDNAIKYTPGPGRVEVSLYVEGESIVVCVRDTGVGIAPEHQHRLFEKFYRIKRRDTVHIRGTGLGLAIVKSVAERHDGRVWVESKLDEGSSFYFSIPYISPEGDPAHSDDSDLSRVGES